MAIICGGDEHCFRFSFVEHVYVIGIEPHSLRNLGHGFVHQVGMRIAYRYEVSFRFGCDVLQQFPDMIVVQTDDGKTCHCGWSWRWRSRCEDQTRKEER